MPFSHLSVQIILCFTENSAHDVLYTYIHEHIYNTCSGFNLRYRWLLGDVGSQVDKAFVSCLKDTGSNPTPTVPSGAEGAGSHLV